MSAAAAAIISLFLIHATCRTHPAHPVPSAAAPAAGNKLLVDGMQSGAGAKHAKSHREQIHYRLSSQYAVNGASTRSSIPCEGARPSGDPCRYLTLIMSWPSDTVTAMLRPGTVAVVCLAAAAVVTVAVREAPAGVVPSPSALSPSALIVALNGNDTNPGTLAQPPATIQKTVNVERPAAAPRSSRTGGPLPRISP